MLGRRRAIAVVGALVWSGCTFPDVTIVESTSTAATSSASAGGAGGTSSSAGGSGGDPCAVLDADRDGQDSTACGGPDCNDNDDRVISGQSAYFGTPMTAPEAPGGPFDFDCSGMEEPDPMQLFTSCSMPLCNGEGYKTGDSSCGTVNGWVVCTLMMLCQETQATGPEALRCH